MAALTKNFFILYLVPSSDLEVFTSIAGTLKRDVFEQLHSHFTGGSWSVWILLHQYKVRVVAVQGIH